MPSICSRCKNSVGQLVRMGDAESSARLSSENRVPIPQYNSVCVECAMELLGISDRQELSMKEQETENKSLVDEIEAQKRLMIAVSTGGPRIQETNVEYKQRRKTLLLQLHGLGIDDPNPYTDLWDWYGKWSSGDLPTYQSRRIYINQMYQPLIDAIEISNAENTHQITIEPTGWERVDRGFDKIVHNLEIATSEEDFQTIGLLCREVIISLAQAVYDPAIHHGFDGVSPSETDAKRMLENYFTSEISGSSNEELRKHAKASLILANSLQHKRTANLIDALLCSEATRTVINIVAIISGKRG